MNNDIFIIGDVLQDKNKDGEIIIVLGYTHIPYGNWNSKHRMGDGISINKKTGKINSFVRISRLNVDGNLIKIGHLDPSQMLVAALESISDKIYPKYKNNKLTPLDKALEFYGE